MQPAGGGSDFMGGGIVRLEDTSVDDLDAADFVLYEPPAADAGADRRDVSG